MGALEGSSFATLLRRHRLARGWTQDELALRARMSARGLSDLERGLKRAPRATAVRLLIQALELPEPEAATLLAAADTPRESTTGVPGTNNLPRALTSFIGREQELATLRRMLQIHPLVTLVGAGGVGKTRLAVETAKSAVPDYADGISVVELASLRDGQLVARAVVEAIRLAEQAGRSPIDMLREALRSRRFLLILDNCEHLIDTCSKLVDELLQSSIHLRILATSREPFHIAGEHCLQLAPLELPSETFVNRGPQHGAGLAEREVNNGERVRAAAAVRLFVERAQASVSNFTLDATNALAVSALCAKLAAWRILLSLKQQPRRSQLDLARAVESAIPP